MNYRDFFKNKNSTPSDITKLRPEDVDPKEFQKGIDREKEHTDDEFIAAKIASDHLDKKKGGDPRYYTKLDAAGLEQQEEHCGACTDDIGGEEYDDFNDGLPKLGGALSIPHLGQPIRLGKIIQIGNEFGNGPATGELSGMTACGKVGGVAKDTGGIPVRPDGDKEPITAGGQKIDSSIVTKSVGGPVSAGGGQKQGGPHSQGTIANTAKLNEYKEKVRHIVKEVLKEIRFDKTLGKWVRINESADKKDEKPTNGPFDIRPLETVNQKMGPSYKKVQPRMYKVADDDFARTNQYDPEISEMIDEEEIRKMQERYVTLLTAPKNLSESELAEMKSLKEKLSRNFGASHGGIEPNLFDGKNVNEKADAAMKMGASYRVVASRQARTVDDDQAHRNQDTPDSTNENTVDTKMGPAHKTVSPRQARVAADDHARKVQYDPEMTEYGGAAVQHRSYRTVQDNPQRPENRNEEELASDVTEGSKKLSKVVKAIRKGQKPKTNKPKTLKYEVPRHTTSGVHKRKT